MTTKNSPQWKLHAQAASIAKKMKAMPPRFNGQDSINAGIVMDDKTIAVEFTWAKLDELTEENLTTLICSLMREEIQPEHGTVH